MLRNTLNRSVRTSLAMIALASTTMLAAAHPPTESFLAGAPEGFIPPPLHPQDIELQTQQLGDGVYALLSGHPAVDNNGFIVGERGVLVIDAHINGAMARQIQDAVRAVTDKPILYLVNTNYHGDHTFGNYAFPESTLIIAHRETAAHMRYFDAELEFMLPTVNDDPAVYSDAELRLPDITFDSFLEVDLGGRVVEIHHFGAGNTAGDAIVYEPQTKTAWTGNLVVGAGTIPPLFEGRAQEYLQTITRFSQELDVQTIIPGHGLPADGGIRGRYLKYLSDLIDSARGAIARGESLEETLAANALDARYLPQPDSPAAALRPFLQGLHQLNVQRTYTELAAR